MSLTRNRKALASRRGVGKRFERKHLLLEAAEQSGRVICLIYTSTETGLKHAQGYIDKKIVYSSKGLHSFEGATKAKNRWMRRTARKMFPGI